MLFIPITYLYNYALKSLVLTFDFISNNTLIKTPGLATNVEARVLSVERPLNIHTVIG